MSRSRWLDPRLALGLAVTVLAVWWSLRGVDFRALGAALAGADLRVAVPGSLACYAAGLWIRALRWRHLAAAVGELPLGVAYRATAIRFMGNNLFPFRLG
ncbi:MAG: flippase-like domain-containing protein [Deltaproteobacteria bacterium]|nr:flippase-like domain-containing protein [Deltaproteobacteria bacterium]